MGELSETCTLMEPHSSLFAFISTLVEAFTMAHTSIKKHETSE